MDSGPVFADPSGRRRRVLRRAGLSAAAGLAICLGAVAVAMAGGPQAPFTQWVAPRSPAAAASGHPRNGHPGAGVSDPAAPAPQPGQASSPSPTSSPSARPTQSGSPTSSASPSGTPTNPAGHTPPGRTKSPNPHKSPHGA